MATMAVTTPTGGRGFRAFALFDMGFEEGGVTGGIDPLARAAGPPGLSERGAQRLAVVSVGRMVDLLLVEHADEGAAAEQICRMSFLIGEGAASTPRPASPGPPKGAGRSPGHR